MAAVEFQLVPRARIEIIQFRVATMTRIRSIGVRDRGINKYIRIPNVQTHSRLCPSMILCFGLRSRRFIIHVNVRVCGRAVELI